MNWLERFKVKTDANTQVMEEWFWTHYDNQLAKNGTRLSWYLRFAGLLLIGAIIVCLIYRQWQMATMFACTLHLHLFLNYRYKQLMVVMNPPKKEESLWNQMNMPSVSNAG